MTSTKKNVTTSVHLPDCVWLDVFKYLEHQDLIKVILLGQQYDWHPGKIAAGSTALWKRVTWRSPKSKKNQRAVPIERITKYIGPHTTSVKVIGHHFANPTWDFKLRARNLKRLQYTDCMFDYSHDPFDNVPRSVTHLFLERISFTNSKLRLSKERLETARKDITIIVE